MIIFDALMVSGIRIPKADIRKDVYFTFCLWILGTSQFLNTSPKNKASGRCLRSMNNTCVVFYDAYSYSVGFESCCSF